MSENNEYWVPPDLYKDKKITIGYDPTGRPGDHLLRIQTNSGSYSYTLQEGTLQDLVSSELSRIEELIDRVNPSILSTLKEAKLPLKGLYLALGQAHALEEEKIKEFTEDLHIKP